MRYPLPDRPEDVCFLTIEQVNEFHRSSLKPGQNHGISKLTDLLGAIGRPQSAVFYDDDPELDLLKVAAYYWHGISTSHGYVDGNKRTGFFSAVNFLLMHGLFFDAPDEYVGWWIDDLFKHNQFTVDNLLDLLKKHTRPNYTE